MRGLAGDHLLVTSGNKVVKVLLPGNFGASLRLIVHTREGNQKKNLLRICSNFLKTSTICCQRNQEIFSWLFLIGKHWRSGSLKRSSSERWRLLFRLVYYPKITFQTWRQGSRLGGGLIKRESGSSGRAASHHLGEGFRHTQSHISITMGMVMMS